VYQQLPAHHAITVASVERPGDPSRTGLHRPAARDGLPGGLARAVRKKPDCRDDMREQGPAVTVPSHKTQGTDGALIQP
jgi:hypothetical protein